MSYVDVGFSELFKRWLKAKWRRENAGTGVTQWQADGDIASAERALQVKASSEVLMAAFPKLRESHERRAEAKLDEQVRYRERVAALPTADVTLDLSGALTGNWSGDLPVELRWSSGGWLPDEEEQPDAMDLHVELVVADEPGAPTVAGLPLLGWNLLLPQCHGPGLIDLTQVHHRYEQAGGELDVTALALLLGSEDEPYYWVPAYGPALIWVGDDRRTLTVRMTVGRNSSELVQVEGSVVLPEGVFGLGA